MGDRVSGGLALKVRVVLLLPEDGSITVKAGYPPEDILDEADLAAAKWAWEHNRAAGRGSDTFARRQAALPAHAHGSWSDWCRRYRQRQAGAASHTGPAPLCSTRSIDQAALAIERVHLVEDLDQAKRRTEADRLRSALLTSISHDLKTPLAAILEPPARSRDLSRSLDDQRQIELLATIIEESERLNRFIANLLDMTKLESGAHQAQHCAARYRRDRGTRCCERARKILNQHRVEVEHRFQTCPCSRSIPSCLSRCCSICSITPPNMPRRERRVPLQSWHEDNAVKLQILDEGSGIPSEDIERIFDKFHEPRSAIRFGLAPASGSPSRAASSKPWAARSPLRTARTGQAPSSPLPCPYQDRPSD